VSVLKEMPFMEKIDLSARSLEFVFFYYYYFAIFMLLLKISVVTVTKTS